MKFQVTLQRRTLNTRDHKPPYATYNPVIPNMDANEAATAQIQSLASVVSPVVKAVRAWDGNARLQIRIQVNCDIAGYAELEAELPEQRVHIIQSWNVPELEEFDEME